ncbi:MAG: hydroxyacid dehydrogenase [Chloroflexi bacterium]|nr:hydroxyacid dehydrogenase [Chloroflexota bacterium]
MTDRPDILIAMRPALFDQLFAEAQQRRLRALGEITLQPYTDNLDEAQLTRLIGGRDIVITCWGTPRFSDAVLAAADRLRLIAHSAGTIKRLLPPPVFAAGRRVTHAAEAMAIPVAETTLLLILLCLRRFHKIDRAFKDEGWAAARALGPGSELEGARVGIIGAGHTGRKVIQKLGALGAVLWLYDPYVSEVQAATLGARKVDLETLLRECPLVSLHAPSTAETYRMLGAEQISWLQDGAIFINTARTHLIDEAALLAELQSGRISAALDVFENEPLPDESPYRQLDNVIITPHMAAVTEQAYRRQGQIITDEIDSFLSAGKLRYEVTRDMLDTMA